MRTLQALHLASFIGNSGDGAMHDGAYRTRAHDCPFRFEYTPLEIREFVHWGPRVFDETFLSYANKFDVIFIGGNSVFQMWRENTASGTYFDFAPDYLVGLRRPVIFYGIGCDATRGVSKSAMAKFKQFLDACMASENFLFSLRNDGSHSLIGQSVGQSYAKPMTIIPDGALFAEPFSDPSSGNVSAPYIIVNLAGDMPDVRYGNKDSTNSQVEFARCVTDHLSELLRRKPDLRCVFAPHIFSDMGLIAECLHLLDDRTRRTRVDVAPYLARADGWREIFGLYRRASAVLSMRFHAGLVAIGLNVPTNGLSTHHKVAGTFAGLGLEDHCSAYSPSDASDASEAIGLAFRRLESDIERPAPIKARQAKAKEKERRKLATFHHTMSEWLARQL